MRQISLDLVYLIRKYQAQLQPQLVQMQQMLQLLHLIHRQLIHRLELQLELIHQLEWQLEQLLESQQQS